MEQVGTFTGLQVMPSSAPTRSQVSHLCLSQDGLSDKELGSGSDCTTLQAGPGPNDLPSNILNLYPNIPFLQPY